MINRIKQLNTYSKVILFLLMSMVLAFSAIYAVTLNRMGFRFYNTVLVPSEENRNIVYSGKVDGTPASFTVSPDKAVVFQYGEELSGPYIMREDPTAIPKKTPAELAGRTMTGLEILRGDKVIFRGCEVSIGQKCLLYGMNGQYVNRIDTMPGSGVSPTAYDLIDLMRGPELTHKGDVLGWICGMLFCILTAVSILFADELFRWQLHWRVTDADSAEPSDWEIARRYISWTLFPILAAILFIMGLR